MGISEILVSFGLLLLVGYLVGRKIMSFRLPSILGCMLLGCLVGPSVVGLLSKKLLESGAIVTDITLGLVAFSIGIELRMSAIRKLGSSIIPIIISESFMAFFVVLGGVYLMTRDLPLALILAAMAPASAPAGTVAVIQETKSRGTLTTALYAVVGFDDGLAILIFSFASSFAHALLVAETGKSYAGLFVTLLGPIKEIIISAVLGIVAGWLLAHLLMRLDEDADVMTVMIGAVFVVAGLAPMAHASLILANLVVGLLVGNWVNPLCLQRVLRQLAVVMPLLFILFFSFAGAHLNVAALPKLGLLGLIYIMTRAFGLIFGAWVGAVAGKAEPKIRKYIGLGILSQAGVAIGLSLIVNHEFLELGSKHAIAIGSSVLTTIAATSVFFEIIGPILARIALVRSGEVKESRI